MNKLLIYLSSLMLMLCSCNSGYEITGQSSFKDMDGSVIYAKMFVDDDWVILDSAEVVHGKFTMNGKVDSVVLATLFAGREALMPVVLENGSIDVVISDMELTAKGTALNNSLYDFIARRNKFEEELAELDHKETKLIMDEGGDLDEIQRQLAEEGQKLSEEMDNYVNKFITDNYDNVLGTGIFMMLCSSLPYPIMTPQLQAIIDNAPYSFKMDRRVKTFIAAAQENMQLIEENRRLQAAK